MSQEMLEDAEAVEAAPRTETFLPLNVRLAWLSS